MIEERVTKALGVGLVYFTLCFVIQLVLPACVP